MVRRLAWHARALAAVLGLRVALWIRPFHAVIAACARLRVPRDPPVSTADTITRAVVAVDRVARVVPGATCLCQALAAQWLLAREGIRSDLRFGVTRGRGTLDAHAWLEIDGRRVIGDTPTPYTPMARRDPRDVG